MRLATIKNGGTETAAIVTQKGVCPIRAVNKAKGTSWKTKMFDLILKEEIPLLTAWYNNGGKEELEEMPGVILAEEAVYGPLYRTPQRIFGIGLNYVDHAGDLGRAPRLDFPEASINRHPVL